MIVNNSLKEKENIQILAQKGFLKAQMITKCTVSRDCYDCSHYYNSECSYLVMQKRIKLFDRAMIPTVFLQATVEVLNKEQEVSSSVGRAVSWILKWSQTMPLPDRGILLSGPTGVGKSFAMAAMVRSLTIDRGIPCLFVDFRQFLMQLKRCYSQKENEYELFENLRNADVLILDDVGAPRDTEWAREIFQTIISQRYNDTSRTFLTTNLSLASSSKRSECQLSTWAGVHSYSRLKQMCYWLQCDGSDKRVI
jgi:DNA replication protein DnaC